MISNARWIKQDEIRFFHNLSRKNPPPQNGCRLKSGFFLKHQFHILHFPNSTRLFTKPISCHYTKYRFSPDIGLNKYTMIVPSEIFEWPTKLFCEDVHLGVWHFVDTTNMWVLSNWLATKETCKSTIVIGLHIFHCRMIISQVHKSSVHYSYACIVKRHGDIISRAY